MGHAERVDVILKGGLGNQLFQYAAARSLADDPSRIVLHSYGNEWGHGHPTLETLLGMPILYPTRARRTQVPRLARGESWKDTISGVIAASRGRASGTVVLHSEDPFEPRPTRVGRRFVLEGYFQHPSWWSDSWNIVANEIAKVCGLHNLAADGARLSAVKLRLTDYRRLGWALPERYFIEAMTALDLRNQPVLVTCESEDERGFITPILDAFECTMSDAAVISGDTNLDDFLNLALATTTVLANSSYSWWAAAVAEILGPGRRAAYPRPWLPAQWSSDVADFGLPGWLPVESGF